MVRCILLKVGLPRSFWGKTSAKTTYLIDIRLFTIIDFKTPIKVWSRKETYYSNLKLFRGLVHVYINLDKLDAKIVKCIFIIYLECVKSYKLWKVEPGESKFIINIYITLWETHMEITNKDPGWRWENKKLWWIRMSFKVKVSDRDIRD